MKKLKVLIVDDSISIRISLKMMLSKMKHINIIGEADSVGQAIELLKTVKPDITILDLNLNDGSGYEVLKEIKSNTNPHTVIVFTNYSSEQFKSKAFEKGADYFFEKLKEFDKVIDLLNNLSA
ncbi:MAG: response regulator transcription factor [Ignavibacteriaceae bacterium]|nr:response regulator transcription factor [Ignavibacteriaceae bacterium]